MKVTMSLPEIHAFADKVARAFTEVALEHEESDTVSFTKEELLADVLEAVGISCGLDQIAGEYDLLMAAHEVLEGSGGELPPSAL